MARVISKSKASLSSTSQVAEATAVPVKEKERKTPKKTKDGWEMSAREALKVDFVVSEI